MVSVVVLGAWTSVVFCCCRFITSTLSAPLHCRLAQQATVDHLQHALDGKTAELVKVQQALEEAAAAAQHTQQALQEQVGFSAGIWAL